MSASFEFRGHLQWPVLEGGTAGRIHRFETVGRPQLRLSSPAEFGGDGDYHNPEEMLLAAVSSCQMLTFLAIAEHEGIAVRRYEDDPRLLVRKGKRGLEVEKIMLRPMIELASPEGILRVRELVQKAHQRCLIAAALACDVFVAPTISAESTARPTTATPASHPAAGQTGTAGTAATA